MNLILRKAEVNESNKIWLILQQAIERRRKDGSNQWQDGYPNLEIVKNDISRGEGFILVNDNEIIGYSAIIINNEPAYDKIEGNWLSSGDFVVVHRIAIADNYLRQGLASKLIEFIEDFAVKNNIKSVKIDTNYDNIPMLKVLKKHNYSYCGVVYINRSPRKAFEKILNICYN